MSDVNKEWHYSIGGNNQGPLSNEQMRALAAAGTINGETLVWASPMSEWLPLARTELARAPAAQPAFAPRPANLPPGMAAAATATDGPSDFMGAVRTCLSKYATFTGRAARPEFWWFYLFSMIVIVVATVIDTAILAEGLGGVPILSTLAVIALFLPQIGALVRRLHDTDRSGWNYFFIFIPLVGVILLIVWLCKPGTPGTNRFG